MSFRTKKFMKYTLLFLFLSCAFVVWLWLDYEENRWLKPLEEFGTLTLEERLFVFLGPRVFFPNLVYPVTFALLLAILVSKLETTISGMQIALCASCGWRGPWWRAEHANGCPRCGNNRFKIFNTITTKRRSV